VATAALLDVGESVRSVLIRMKEEGYDIGECDPRGWKGDDIVSVMREISMTGGERGVRESVRLLSTLRGAVNRLPGAQIYGAEVSPSQLKGWLGADMTQKMERQWGDLETYRNPDLGTTSKGNYTIIGLQIGKILIGLQPLLGVEGDPMRLLFERDLTPHPQYAAFYKWLERERNTHVNLHFGMHGTVEWLPGSPLGNTQYTWPDLLLGTAPNMYIYACNNPSESILAKRRGYATVISHNVPPYSRAGLYQQLLAVRGALSDYRSERGEKARDCIPLLVSVTDRAGLFDDLPFNDKYCAPKNVEKEEEREREREKPMKKEKERERGKQKERERVIRTWRV